MTFALDGQLAELNPPPELRAELGDFLDQHLHVRRRGVGDSTVTPSPVLHAGWVVGSASRFTWFSLRARRRNFFFFFFFFFTVLTGAAVPASCCGSPPSDRRCSTLPAAHCRPSRFRCAAAVLALELHS